MLATLQSRPAIRPGPLGLLARNFPHAVPVRFAVSVRGVDARGRAFAESTVVELATPLEVLFCSALPFQPGDQICVAAADGGFAMRASVVAIRYRNGKSAVAARLTEAGAAFPLRRS